MVFSSAVFLCFFLPAFLLIYFAFGAANVTILIFSIIFYSWGEPRFLPILILYILLNYFGGRIASNSTRFKFALLAVFVGADLGFLIYFKYFNFLVDQLNHWLGHKVGPLRFSPVPLPLGISFIAFQGISYLVDVYRGVVDSQRNLISFAMYKSMFPQLIAGPIVRYSDIAADIDRRRPGVEDVAAGARQFLVGLGQKVLIANVLAPTADDVFDAAGIGIGAAWLGLACYTLQIYFDFAGYSNMAIGLGRIMGFKFPINFDRPYASQSITEFWRRWHMTLSRWFRDYLYIPLGGSRVSAARTYLNLFIVFLLCGFWHGASWNFLLWGAYHGAFLSVERAGWGAVVAAAPRPLRHVYVMLAVSLGWVLFRCETMRSATSFYLALAGATTGSVLTPWDRYLTLDVALALGIGAILATAPILDFSWIRRPMHSAPLARVLILRGADVGLIAILALSLFEISSGAYNPFIYYRF